MGIGKVVWVLAKPLEKGRFSWPTYAGDKKITMEPTALMMLMTGIDFKKNVKSVVWEVKVLALL